MRVLKVVILTMVAALTAGCAATPSASPPPSQEREAFSPHALSKEEIQQIEAAVLQSLGVTDALFAGLEAARSPAGSFVACGWIRLRSPDYDYARYPTNRPFVVSYERDDNALRNFRITHFARVESEAPPLYPYCLARGIKL